jgi:hypothetical protein
VVIGGERRVQVETLIDPRVGPEPVTYREIDARVLQVIYGSPSAAFTFRRSTSTCANTLTETSVVLLEERDGHSYAILGAPVIDGWVHHGSEARTLADFIEELSHAE